MAITELKEQILPLQLTPPVPAVGLMQNPYDASISNRNTPGGIPYIIQFDNLLNLTPKTQKFTMTAPFHVSGLYHFGTFRDADIVYFGSTYGFANTASRVGRCNGFYSATKTFDVSFGANQSISTNSRTYNLRPGPPWNYGLGPLFWSSYYGEFTASFEPITYPITSYYLNPFIANRLMADSNSVDPNFYIDITAASDNSVEVTAVIAPNSLLFSTFTLI